MKQNTCSTHTTVQGDSLSVKNNQIVAPTGSWIPKPSFSSLRNSLFCLVLGASALAFVTNSQAALIFDNVSNFRNSVPGAVGTSTGSTPNTFMGGAFTLASGATTITGFDIYPVNLSGTSFNSLKINIFVWGTVNLGTVSASAPAFSNLLGSYSLTSSGTFTTGFFVPYENAVPGTAPGITLGSPLALTGSKVGVTFNFQGSTDGGASYASINSLTSLITYGSPATVGANVFNGYYRNAASESNGNFTSTLRSLGTTLTDQSIAMRIYGDVVAVPEPTGMALAGLGCAALVIFRRRR